MEQQAQLRDALNEALTAEVQRLKLATAELGDSHSNRPVDLFKDTHFSENKEWISDEAAAKHIQNPNSLQKQNFPQYPHSNSTWWIGMYIELV
ncbi:Transcription factor RF2b [Acorus calamus]|uniref:Transcription factor RF2b n=1 Tax=Acorus calamus TaxID=4465 RepID=A0AAV9FIP6_ACOCL|nr:Transcription factor RF2b [Acorus calamus]